MADKQIKEIIQKYTDQAFKLFPCNPDKTPALVHGFKDAHDNFEVLCRQFYREDFLIGLPTGNVNGIVVIDFDLKDGRTLDELKEELSQFGELPETLRVQTPSGGEHWIYTVEETNINSAVRFFDKTLPIDIRANGGYICGADYKNYFPLDCEGIEFFRETATPLPAWIEGHRKHTEYVEQQPTSENLLPASEVREIRSALAFIDSDDRDMWVRIGHALKSTGTAQAKGLWLEWSQKSDKFDPVDAEKKWKTFKPRDVTIASVFGIAKQNGWVTTYESNNNIVRNISGINTLADNLERIINFTIKTYTVSETFSELNKKDLEALRDGTIIGGGEKSSGKTSIIAAISLDILKNNPETCLLFYTLDDADIITGKRLLSQISNKNLFHSTEFDSSRCVSLLKRIVLLEECKVIIADPKEKDEDEQKNEQENKPAGILNDAQKVKEKTGCKNIIIILDYLQLVSSGDRTSLNNAVKELKNIQKQLVTEGGCILFILSQLNRDRNSGTSRYRETSEIENIADVCIDIRHEFIEIQNPISNNLIMVPDKKNPARIINIEKNKLGIAGQIFETKIHDDFTFDPLVEKISIAEEFVKLQGQIITEHQNDIPDEVRKMF